MLKYCCVTIQFVKRGQYGGQFDIYNIYRGFIQILRDIQKHIIIYYNF